MTNYEKMSDTQKKKYLCDDTTFGVTNYSNTIVDCDNLECRDCLFNELTHCSEGRLKWLNSDSSIKYQIPFKTPVDTPVEVSNDNEKWCKRYFSGKFTSDGKVLVWNAGKTSWTANNEYDVNSWDYCRLPN